MRSRFPQLASSEALPLLAMVGATLLWGSSFYTIAQTLASTDPVTLVMMRFGCGLLLVAPLLGKRLFQIPAYTWRAGIICGVALTASYGAGTWGLMTITSSASGFITALYVPFTPLLVWMVYGKSPQPAAYVGAAVAFLGLVLLANPFTMTFEGNVGELATLLSAFLSAVEIIIAGRYAPKCNPKELAFTQLVMTAFYSGVLLVLLKTFEPDLLPPTDWSSLTFWGGILWLGTIVALAQILLGFAQRTVPPDRAAVIYALESVFAAIIGYWAGERLGVGGLTGGAFIVLAVFVSETQFVNRLWYQLKWRLASKTSPEKDSQ